MKKLIFILSSVLIINIIGCKDNPKKETNTSVEITVERNDSLTKAIITTTKMVNGEAVEDIQTIEGAHEEVMAKVNALKKEVEPSEENVQVERKTIKKIQFMLNPKSGSDTSGKVTFTEEDGQVTLEATLSGLSEGTHAIHIHEQADCSADNGSSAGGHWNPTFQNHGAWGDANGFHRGDIGNFQADANGNGSITFSTDLWCLGCEDPVKNLSGKAVIVHQGADDLTSQPAGDAGARVSCAGIIE